MEDYENYQLFSAIYQESFYIDQDIFLWRVGDESANCTGQLSAYFDNYTDTSVYGTFDGLLAPTIDFTNITNATLTFDYAYAQYTSGSTTYNDSLIIAVATGCAPSTYYIIYEEGGAGLATASPHIDVFTPTCNEWQSIQVDLSQYSGEEYVTVAIVNHSGYGNILWVDNINIVETQPSNCSVSIISSPEICDLNNGSASAVISNTTGNVSYLWSNGATTSTITGLNAGVYGVSITDASGCTANASVVVNSSCNTNCSVLAFSTPVSCNGNDGTATAVASNTVGSISYLWSNGATSPIITGLSTGVYAVTITDGNGCTSSSSVNVNNGCNTNCTVTTTSTPVSCAGNNGTATAFASNTVGNVTYLWSNGATSASISGLNAGVYGVSITDATGCISTSSVTVGNNCNTNCSVNTTSTPVSCVGNNGTATATASNTVGNVTYLWSNGATTSIITGLSAGSYSVSITDATGCSSTSSVVVGNNCNTNCSVNTSSTPVSCNGNDGIATATATNTVGNVSYLWNTGATTATISGLSEGAYSVSITDATGCSSTSSVVVGNNCNTNCSVNTSSTPVSCNGNDGIATATATNTVGNVSYLWNTGATTATISGLSEGAYSVSITDATGCVATSSVVVNSNCVSNCNVEIDYTEEICGTNTGYALASTTNTTGSVHYTWSNGISGLYQNAIFGLSAGTYSVTAIDEDNCVATTSFNIESIPNCIADVGIVEHVISPSVLSACENTFDVVVKVENLGTETVNSLTIVSSINGGVNIQTINTGFSVSPGQISDFELPNVTLPNEDFTLRINITFVNGEFLDDNGSNDTLITNYQVLNSAQSLPFNEDFENENLPTSNGVYQIGLNNNDGNQWAIANESANCVGNNAAFFNNFDNPSVDNTNDALIIPSLDFTNISNAHLTLDYAYAQYQAGYTDSLYIKVSTDCGETYNNVLYANGGADLATTALNGNSFVPECNDWSNIEIDLSQFAGESSVTIAIINASDYGNNIWVDNINIEEVIPLVYDLAIKNIAPYNNASLCYDENENFTTAVIEIENLGTGTIKSVGFNRYINGQFNGIYGAGNINLAPGEKDTFEMQALNLPEGEFTFKSEIYQFTTMENVLITEDANPANDTAVSTYWALTPQTLPYFEDFENESLPTAEGLHQFGFEDDDIFDWKISQSASANCNGLNAALFVNYFGFGGENPSGTRDGLITPTFDFSTVVNPKLSFDYAYATYEEGFIDSLYVLVSTDCGETFNEVIFAEGNENLATAPEHVGPFVPECNEWQNIN
ncbi:MAG: hypothetical protein R2728_03985 [Chitinophagales bacterium]